MEPIAIRRLRLRLKETQVQFAARFNVTQITVAYWESGRSQPMRGRLDELAVLASSAARATAPTLPFRPIQYLGSKQRLAETIAEVMAEVSPGNRRVADLFAGSGVVSHVLGAQRPVTAVDIQAYSEALVRALLTGQQKHFAVVTSAQFLNRIAETVDHIERLARPLLELERDALASASLGDTALLVELMDFGSLAIYEQRSAASVPTYLAKCLRTVRRAFDSSKLSPADLTATTYFGGPYFSFSQAIALDAIAIAARTSKTPGVRHCAMAVLLSTASDIVNTVGKQFAQPMRLQKADGRIQPLLLQRALRDRSLDAITRFREWAEKWKARVPSGNFEHVVECSEAREFAARDRTCSAYYADPPYTIDHYSRFYHVLETLVLRDSPRLAEMNKRGRPAVMRGVYRSSRYQSAFCIPSEAPKAFESLIAGAAKHSAPLILSYSPFDEEDGHRPRLLTLDDLVGLAKRHYRKVMVMEISEHSHRKLNAKAVNSSARSDAERLLICEV